VANQPRGGIPAGLISRDPSAMCPLTKTPVNWRLVKEYGCLLIVLRAIISILKPTTKAIPSKVNLAS